MNITRRTLLSLIPAPLLARFAPVHSGGIVAAPAEKYIVGEHVCAGTSARDSKQKMLDSSRSVWECA